MFCQVICFCERWYYKINYKYERCKHTENVGSSVVFFSSIFLLSGDSKIYLMFFIQLIWWIRTRLTFEKFDQAKMSQILLYTLLNLFDSTNFIKLIGCISGDLSIVHWFK